MNKHTNTIQNIGYISAIKQANQKRNDSLPDGYMIDKEFGNGGYLKGRSGVEVAAVINQETGERIIAIAGTNEWVDKKDWPNVGRKQWRDAKVDVLSYISNQPQNVPIKIVGHSLGGGVAQYAMYDIKGSKGQLSDRSISAVTFDAPGVKSSIENYDNSRIKLSDINNIIINGSAVPKLGGEHIGDVSSIQPKSGEKILSNHSIDKIEENLKHYENSDISFGKNKPEYIDVPEMLDKAGNATGVKWRDSIAPQSSISPTLRERVGRAGEAITNLGEMSFDAASSVGKDALAHTVTQAVAHGGAEGKAILGNAARAAMGQMLGRMHGEVVREINIQQPLGTPGFNPHASMPAAPPEEPTRKAIEKTINDPGNAGVFDKVAQKVAAILKSVEGADPSAVLAAKVLEELRGGNIKVQPHILVPDLIPQEGTPTNPSHLPLEEVGKSKKAKRKVIEVGGLKIAINIPEVEYQPTPPIAANATKNLMPGGNKLPPVVVNGGVKMGNAVVSRSSNGKVNVRAYTRADGTQVAAHTRTEADGIPTNNLSKK